MTRRPAPQQLTLATYETAPEKWDEWFHGLPYRPDSSLTLRDAIAQGIAARTRHTAD